MGGMGSGGWNHTYHLTTDDTCRLDVNKLRKDGYFDEKYDRKVTWSMNGIVQLELKARYDGGTLHLSDATSGGSSHPDNYKQCLEIVTRTPAVGGSTKLFKCPCCFKARVHLYLHDPFFICRECAGVTYQSRRERAPIRAFRRWHKLSKKLGGIKMDEWFWVPKPRGMHQKTFERLKQEISEAESFIERETWASLGR